MRKRKWTNTQLKNAVRFSRSYRQVLKHLNLIPAGGNYAQVKKYIQELNISTHHLKGKGWSQGLRGIGKPRIPLEQILIKGSTFQSYKLKKRLFTSRLRKPRCEMCGWAKKSADRRIPLELDHINGDSLDNRLENLRILCPNCHSLQPTHRGLNMKKRI